jgi:hypothetical protein
VARAFPDLSIRIEKLSFKHHQMVAGKVPEEQVYWLKLALERGWSTAQLRRAIAGQPLTREPTALIDRTLSFADRAEREAAKLTPDDRARIADELEAAARRIRSLR